MKSYLIVANWKQNGDSSLCAEYLKIKKTDHAIVVCPPYHLLSELKLPHGYFLGAQNVSPFPNGSYTGEIGAEMLKKANVSYCIVGHSERRELFKETVEHFASKIKLLLSFSITPIICVGESIADYKLEKGNSVVRSQLTSLLSTLDPICAPIIVAYEPIWSIGTGLIPTSEYIISITDMIKSCMVLFRNKNIIHDKILYGGSVNEDTISTTLSIREIQGVLVGGASLKIESFNKLIVSYTSRDKRSF
ncbi:MAG: triose-phosphate isomerase [Methylacidiphilales bacterium]|nr:triose-phosphate isomerase [Candidatus Methylacidiphilales bacterium]